MLRGNSFRRSLNALPHDGPSLAVRIAHVAGWPDARIESAAAVRPRFGSES